jgi:hypothetical protein
MSQFISPVEWLQSALTLFMVSNIVENTTTDARGLLWTCELSFYIPTRGPSPHPQLIHRMGRQMASRISAQCDTVSLYLVALQRICYQVADYSDFKIQALHAGRLPVAQVSEMLATQNVMDVVKSSLIPDSCLFVVIILILFSVFFLFLDPLADFAP